MAICGQATGSGLGVGDVDVATAGHAANSQFGPVRPTEEPSGQIIASIVQATILGGGVCLQPMAKKDKAIKNEIFLIIVVFYTLALI